MPYKIRTSYKEAGIGPQLVSKEGVTLKTSVPVEAINHFFAMKRAFHAKKYMNTDYTSTPVEISSYNDGRRYIVRIGDLYAINDEHPEGWASNETHAQQGAHVCPKCGSDDTEGGNIEVEGNKATQRMLCHNEKCLECWTNVFTLTEYHLD